MKYIRTRDGIFEFAKRFNLEHYRNVGFSDEDIVKKFIRNGNKIADTIEELCDKRYWLVYWKNREPEIIAEWFAKIRWQINRNSIVRVCACILTDKGLIPVAQLNDKEDLELL